MLTDLVRDVLSYPVAEVQAQCWGTQTDALVETGRALAAIDPRVVVKVPITREGVEAVAKLHAFGIPTTLTAVYAAHQALTAAAAGSDYVAPYYGRVSDGGQDGLEVIKRMLGVLAASGAHTRLLVATSAPPTIWPSWGRQAQHFNLQPDRGRRSLLGRTNGQGLPQFRADRRVMKPCPERLRDKVALVTGGARGIGQAICERFAAEGARVAVADLDATECARVAGEIGEGTFGVRLDVTNQGSIDAAVGAVVEKFGRIDVLINNAGVWELQPLLEMTRERTARVFAVNVEGLIFTTQAVARQMITQGQGGASSTSLPRQDGAAKRFRSPIARPRRPSLASLRAWLWT